MKAGVRSRAVHLGARLGAAIAGWSALLLLPAPALGHQLNEHYEAPLPLVAYVAGAALAVAMSFVFVMLRSAPVRAIEAPPMERSMPLWLRRLLQSLGIVAWVWIIVQAFVGGTGDGDVASLFLWVYGWVGVALLSALGGPIWSWLDPFSTIHSILSGIGARLGLSGGSAADLPAWLGRWPAVIGFVVIVWLELVGRADGGRQLGLFLLAYTVFTVAAMSYFGRTVWRERGETFSVWFGLLGRLAPIALAGEPQSGRMVRRPFAAGLLAAGWTRSELVLVALGTGSIIFDGLSQTQLYFDLFIAQAPLGGSLARDTITGVIFLGAITLLVLGTARLLGVRAVAAGLLPVAVGYLIAHYLTFLLFDGQRIIAALNDPLLRGDNLLPFDLGFWEPTSFIPVSIVWSIQLAAVIGGHIVGAWSGHAALVRGGSPGRVTVMEQLPLAALMVALTSITLWSLGQAVIVNPPVAAGLP